MTDKTERRGERKSIKVYADTYRRLIEHGRMDESMDDLINRILDDWETDGERDDTE